MTYPLRIHEERNLAIVPNVAGAAQLIPHARVHKRNGYEYLLVPARKEELQLLRNLGFEAPSPLTLDYDWGGNEPFKAQVETANMLIHSPRAYVLNDMGTGKTLSALFAFDYLRQQGLVQNMLVLAPLSTLVVVWQREVFTRMNHLTCVNLWHRERKGRLKALKQEGDIYVLNHNGPGVILSELLARRDFDVIVIDELAVFRNKQTDLWKHANAVCIGRKFVWGMTGSPTPKEPVDAWAQCKLITPGTVPKYFKPFREACMTQITQFKWVPKRDANDIVHEVMQPAVRYTRDDCVDLPETTYSDRQVDMNPDQKKTYSHLMDKHYAEFIEGRVTASNEGVKMSKLLQVACGFAYTEDKAIVDLKPTARVNELADLIASTEHKVIVFTPFKHSVDYLYAQLQLRVIGSVEKVYGDTPAPKRAIIFNNFQTQPSMKCIVAHPQCMAHGVTLTAADTIIWYAPHVSLEIYEQANARITRPGQKNHTHIIHIESTPIERKIYSRLRGRASAQGALLEMFEQQEKGLHEAV